MSNPAPEIPTETNTQTSASMTESTSIQANGVEPNGIKPNGMRPNGIRPNGIRPNGIKPNGIKPNGIQLQGKRPHPVDNGDQLEAMTTLEAGDNCVRVQALVIDGVRIESDSPEGIAIESIVVNGIRFTAKDGQPLQITVIPFDTEETIEEDAFDAGAISVTTVELPNGDVFRTENSG